MAVLQIVSVTVDVLNVHYAGMV